MLSRIFVLVFPTIIGFHCHQYRHVVTDIPSKYLEALYFHRKMNYIPPSSDESQTSSTLYQLSQGARKLICETVLSADYFKERNVEIANKSDGVVRQMSQTVLYENFELHYPFDSLDYDVNSQDNYLVTDHAIMFSTQPNEYEILLPCLASSRASANNNVDLIEYFLSCGYKPLTWFLFARNTANHIVLSAIVEGQPFFFTELIGNKSIEEYYVEERISFEEGVQGSCRTRNEFRGEEKELQRLFSLILLNEKLSQPSCITENALLYLPVWFHMERYNEYEWYEEVIECIVINEEGLKIRYYFTQSYFTPHAVFLFTETKDKSSIVLSSYISNLAVLNK